MRCTTTETKITQIEEQIFNKKIIYKTELLSILLDTPEKIKAKILHSLKINPYIIHRKEHLELNEDTKHNETTLKVSELLKPDYIDSKKTYARIGNKYYIGMYITEMPMNVSANWLNTLASERSNIDFCIYANPISKDKSRRELDHHIKMHRYNKAAYRSKGAEIPEELHIKEQEDRDQLHSLLKGHHKRFEASIYILAKGETLKEAETLSRRIKGELEGEGFEIKYAHYRHQDLIQSLLPLGLNQFKHKTILTDDVLGHSIPFSNEWLDIDKEDGTLLGWTGKGLPIIKSRWKLQAYNSLTIGETGSGKSFANKLQTYLESLTCDIKYVDLDPAATNANNPEYQWICEMRKGKYLEFSPKSKNTPPIIQFFGENFIEAKSNALNILYTILGNEDGDEKSEYKKAVIKEALTEIIRDKGINERPKTWEKHISLRDLYNKLKKNKRKVGAEKDTQWKQGIYESVLMLVQDFIKGGLYDFMDTNKTPLDLSNPYTVITFRQFPKDINHIPIACSINYVNDISFNDRNPVSIRLDEAHRWLANKTLAKYIRDLYVTGRKTNTGMNLITQGLSQFGGDKETITILSNTQFAYIFGLKEGEIGLAKSVFNLNDVEIDYIRNSGPGQGLLIYGRERHRVRILASDDVKEVLETNPQKVQEIRKKHLDHEMVYVESMKFFKEDLGKVPKSIEEGAMKLARKIKKGDLPTEIVGIYPNPTAKLIKAELEA